MSSVNVEKIGYTVYAMPSDKPLINFVIDQELLAALDDFRFAKRFQTRAAAIKWLLEWGLARQPEVNPPTAKAKENGAGRKPRKKSVA